MGKNYHPLDVRYKPTKPASRTPWREVGKVTPAEPQPEMLAKPTWADNIQKERAARRAEDAQSRKIATNPLSALSPVGSIYSIIRAGDRVRGIGISGTAGKVVAAFALYFGLMHLDAVLGLNEMLFGLGGSEFGSLTVEPGGGGMQTLTFD